MVVRVLAMPRTVLVASVVCAVALLLVTLLFTCLRVSRLVRRQVLSQLAKLGLQVQDKQSHIQLWPRGACARMLTRASKRLQESLFMMELSVNTSQITRRKRAQCGWLCCARSAQRYSSRVNRPSRLGC